jgi:hypothetical protein
MIDLATATFLHYLLEHHARHLWAMERLIRDQGYTPQELAAMTPAVLGSYRAIGPQALDAYAQAYRALNIETCEEWSDYGQ